MYYLSAGSADRAITITTHQVSAFQSNWEDQTYAEPLLCAKVDVTVPQLNWRIYRRIFGVVLCRVFNSFPEGKENVSALQRELPPVIHSTFSDTG